VDKAALTQKVIDTEKQVRSEGEIKLKIAKLELEEEL
jgi:hypothetical protein